MFYERLREKVPSLYLRLVGERSKWANGFVWCELGKRCKHFPSLLLPFPSSLRTTREAFGLKP